MFIGRRQDGTIYGSWTCKQPDDADHPCMEELPDDHPDVIAFLLPKQKISKRQAAIDALLAEQAKLADAPQAVKDYIDARQPQGEL